MRERDSKSFVIDTDVLRRSGNEKATFPAAKNCRDFLNTVQLLTYYVVISPELNREWNKHASTFARRWRVAMEKQDRVCYIKPAQDKKIESKVLETSRSKKQEESMKKDLHLINAALATDQTVISCEQKIRKLFARATKQVKEIRKVIWVNPERTVDEKPIEWLQNGAPAETHRQLSAYST